MTLSFPPVVPRQGLRSEPGRELCDRFYSGVCAPAPGSEDAKEERIVVWCSCQYQGSHWIRGASVFPFFKDACHVEIRECNTLGLVIKYMDHCIERYKEQ